MAAVIICDRCGKAVSHKNALHIRVYKLTSATSYKASCAEEVFDVCLDCCKDMQSFIKDGGTKDGN